MEKRLEESITENSIRPLLIKEKRRITSYRTTKCAPSETTMYFFFALSLFLFSGIPWFSINSTATVGVSAKEFLVN